MSPTTLHAAFLGLGAALGAGAMALGMRNSKSEEPKHKAPPSPVPVPAQHQTPITPAGAQQLMPEREVYGFNDFGPTYDLLRRKAYIASYDRRLRHPAWTAEHLTAESLKKLPNGGDRSNSSFYEDKSIPAMFRSTLADYLRSGYDRGHMVPAADVKRNQDAMNETFALSNIAPQVGHGFNRHYWAYLEDFCRRLTSQFSDVFVFTIPLYLPKLDPVTKKYFVSYEVIGPDKGAPSVSVPTHFAKVILAFKTTPKSPDPSSQSTALIPYAPGPVLGAFVLPNAEIPDDVPLTQFISPVEAVEKASGLSLFNDHVKKSSKQLCATTKCDVIVRRFDDAQKKIKEIK